MPLVLTADTETYAAALTASLATIPQGLANRLLAARWAAVLAHAIAAGDRRSLVRAAAELRRCGAKATAHGLFDHYQVLAERFSNHGKASRTQPS